MEQITTVNEVTAEQIERSGARTIDEAIRTIPGIYVRNGGDGVPRIDIRGFRTRSIILLVDGVPQNATFDGQFDPRAIPVENIARIKVTLGGSSVLYGPGGNAAVIDIITKSAGPGLHATAEGGVGFGREKDARASASYGSETIRSFVSASIYEQEKFELPGGFAATVLQPGEARKNSDREDRSFYANTAWTPSDAARWGISVNYHTGSYGKPPSTVGSTNNQGTACQTVGGNTYPPCSPFASGTRFERVDDSSSISLQTSGLLRLGGGFSLRPLAYYNQIDELSNNYDNLNYSTQLLNGAASQDATTAIYGGGAQLAYRADAENLVTVAVDGHRETWNADGFSRGAVTVSTQCAANNAACKTALTQKCAALGGNLAKSVTFKNNQGSATCNNVRGATSTDASLDVFSAAVEYETQFTSQLSGVFGAGWAAQERSDSSDSGYTYLAGLRLALTPDTALRGSVARKIRFPTLRNLFELGDGNPNLETEVTKNYEVALEQNFASLNAFLTVALFRIDAENFIEKDRISGLFQNDESLRFQGIETAVTVHPLEGLTIQTGYTYLEATNLEPPVAGGTTAVQNEPRHKAMVSVNYKFDTGTTVWADYLYVADSVAISKDNMTTLDLEPYNLINLGISQDIPGQSGLLQVFGRISNVLDENYETSFGFPEPGRTFFAGLRTKL